MIPVKVEGPKHYKDQEIVDAWRSFLGGIAAEPKTVLEKLTHHTLATQLKQRELDPILASEGIVYKSLTTQEIAKVLRSVRPEVMEVVHTPGSQWAGGPSGVWVNVETFWGDRVCYGYGRCERKHGWDDFNAFALNKAHVSLLERKPSEECTIVALIKHDSKDRNRMGGNVRGPLSTGASGLTEAAEKQCTWIVLDALEAAQVEKNKAA